jgi:hypothetical protein
MSWLIVVGVAGALVAWLTSETSAPPARSSVSEPNAGVIEPAAADRPEAADVSATARTPLSALNLWATPEETESKEPPDETERKPVSEPEPRPNPRLAPRTQAPRASDGWSGPKDPRAAPPGTSEANAEALRRLPVARADQAPVGGIGVLGIHVDRIAVGSIYDSGRCTGHETGFSASRNDRVSACFRVVHPRTTQQVNVLWARNGETVRRTKMTIPSAHAYRTRAFIVLRDGDAGRWTVRVLSSDDVELARARFDVGP